MPDFHWHPPRTEDTTDPMSPSPFQMAWNLEGPPQYWAWSLILYSSLEQNMFPSSTWPSLSVLLQNTIDFCPSNFHTFKWHWPTHESCHQGHTKPKGFFCLSIDFFCLSLELKWTLPLSPLCFLARGFLSPYVHPHVVSVPSLNTHAFSRPFTDTSISSLHSLSLPFLPRIHFDVLFSCKH